MSPLLFYEKALAVNKVSGKIITNLIHIISNYIHIGHTNVT